MSFVSMMKDTIELLKQDGTRTTGIKGSVQQGLIITYDSSVLIEPHDLIIRKASNGAEESYEVIDPVFHEKFESIPANYQILVRKLGVPEAQRYVQNITYNLSGAGARVNSNSIDNSVNTINTGSQVSSEIASIRREIAAAGLGAEKTLEATEIINAVEQQFSEGTPSKTIVRTLLGALPSLASIVKSAAAIIASLS